MNRIQFASDLHLEFGNLEFNDSGFINFSSILSPSAPILVLAGDICVTDNRNIELFRQFFQWVSKNWTLTVFVPGNHDFLGFSYEVSTNRLRNLCNEFNNITYANNNVIHISPMNEFTGITLLCCTLWSHIPKEHSDAVYNSLIEYKSVDGLTVQNVNDMHFYSRNWLINNINKYKNKSHTKLVVVTHHAPISNITSHPRFKEDPLNCAFSSDCLSIMENVNLWIFGHTHYNCDFTIDNEIRTRVVSNQRGYQNQNNGYNKKFVIEM